MARDAKGWVEQGVREGRVELGVMEEGREGVCVRSTVFLTSHKI